MAHNERRTLVVSLWDLSLVLTCLLPFPFAVALTSGRHEAAAWYAGIWAAVVVVTAALARLRRYPLRDYLADTKIPT